MFFGWHRQGGNFTNVAKTSSLKLLTEWHEQTGKSGFLELQSVFFKDTDIPGAKGLAIRGDWSEAWSHTLSELRPLVESGAVIGVHLGDELVWNNVTWRDLDLVATQVKHDLPNLVVYYDEGGAPLWSEPCRNINHLECDYPHVPSAIDVVSTDDYLSLALPRSNHGQPETFYNRYLYPKMLSHQKAMVIPPVSNLSLCQNHSQTVHDLDTCVLDETKRYLRWIEHDARIVGLDAFHFGTYGHDIGLEDLPLTRACYATLAAQLLRAGARPRPL